MNPFRQLLSRVRRDGTCRRGAVETVAMGRERRFRAWDLGDDTFVFEEGVAQQLDDRTSVLIVAKRELKPRAHGWVFTLTTGNHSVAAFPLLDGRFWGLSRVPAARRGEVLMRSILCANVVDGVLEVSQRDVASKTLFAADEWLLGAVALPLNAVTMVERNPLTVEHYRLLGQEWRIKPLVWTQSGMRAALAGAKKRISSQLHYYHGSRGVHFLTLPEFRRFLGLATAAPDEFVKGLQELVSVFEGNPCSFTRLAKYRGHHEIEFFGIRRGLAVETLVPELEKLMESIALGRIGQLGIVQRSQEIGQLSETLLTRPELANEESPEFVETLYIYVTGEIYSVLGEGSVKSFDDRRQALPGATFVQGRPQFHPGADERTQVLFSNLRLLISRDETIEYANVYELSGGDAPEPGQELTRELVFKTNRNPLEQSFVEKRLSDRRRQYGSYMLARVKALSSLGMNFSPFYRLLLHRPHEGAEQRGRETEYYIRLRCEGEPMDAIPANYFASADDASVEDKETVLRLAVLLGDAAAQNMAMKKYDPRTVSPLFGVGKEIYEFEYDLAERRVVPKSVSVCSLRGAFGWPCLDFDDENLHKVAAFYLQHFAHALKAYCRKHPLVTLSEATRSFLNGFEFRTHAMAWQLSVLRDHFESFHPQLPAAYGFDRKWRFIMWSLERQERRLPQLRRIFFEKVALVEAQAEAASSRPPSEDDEVVVSIE